MWPGTNSVKEFATAMIGFRPMSAPGTPEARIRARAPAMLRPWVTVRDLSSGIVARSFSDLRSECSDFSRAYAGHPEAGTRCPDRGTNVSWRRYGEKGGGHAPP
ncbi:hypothetical protein GCM10020256_32490 [Streptomyces thermocoprophilus]